jgi:hypothetical protein
MSHFGMMWHARASKGDELKHGDVQSEPRRTTEFLLDMVSCVSRKLNNSPLNATKREYRKAKANAKKKNRSNKRFTRKSNKAEDKTNNKAKNVNKSKSKKEPKTYHGRSSTQKRTLLPDNVFAESRVRGAASWESLGVQCVAVAAGIVLRNPAHKMDVQSPRCRVSSALPKDLGVDMYRMYEKGGSQGW